MVELSGRFAEDGTHLLRVRVYYEDTDAGGIVYHTGYLRFMERGRSELLHLRGHSHAALAADAGVVFAVRRLEIAFKAPARLEDTLEVATRIQAIGGASFAFAQTIRRDERDLVTATVEVAAVGADGRPVRLPAPVRSSLAQLMEHQHQQRDRH